MNQTHKVRLGFVLHEGKPGDGVPKLLGLVMCGYNEETPRTQPHWRGGG